MPGVDVSLGADGGEDKAAERGFVALAHGLLDQVLEGLVSGRQPGRKFFERRLGPRHHPRLGQG